MIAPVSTATLIIMGLFCASVAWSFFFYRYEMIQNAKELRDIIKTLEKMIAERESVINELHVKMMAKDLTDYRVNTKSEFKEDFVQSEPENMPLEQASDEQFFKAIKEATVEPADSVSLL